MSAFYDRMLATASRLIQQFGSEHVFTKTGEAVRDPATGKITYQKTPYSAFGVLIDFSDEEKASGTINVGDLNMLTTVADYAINDTVEISDIEYKIMSLNPLKPAGTKLRYILRLSR